MNHQALIERSHKQAADKGFWEQPLTFDMAMALIISEIAEALEAYRKGRVNPDWNDTQAVKDSFEVELADAIIRIYDWAGGNNLELEPEDDHTIIWSENEGKNWINLFVSCTHCATSEVANQEVKLECLLEDLLSYCKFKQIDIEKYIMWKLDYNLSRPYKHGKQF